MKLLKKYIQHVLDCEGITFIRSINCCESDVVFTKEEIEILLKLRKEVIEER